MSLRDSPQAEFDPSAITVLVVDDHAYMRAIIGEVLRGAGIGRIIGASNGVEALDEIAAYQPDVVITDWDMDCMDGNELARTVRASAGPSRDVPIIMMSGDTRRAQINLARQSGVDEYIAKPVSAHKILTRLRQVCRRPRPFVESPAYNGPCRRRVMFNYAGPLRRMSDPIQAPPPGVDLQEEQQRVVAACIERVHEMALDLDPGDRLQARAIYNSANEANAVASESLDKCMARATKSLLRYLQGVGATDRMQADVVGTHLDAIQKLVALPSSNAAERELLAEGLERVVSKKLKPVEAA